MNSPKRGKNYFKAINPQRSGNTFSVSTQGKAGRTYVLERSITLAAGSWIIVDTENSLAADGPVTLTDPSSTGSSVFYQIRVTGP